MTEVIFHPHWAGTLRRLVNSAGDKPVTLHVPSHLDAAVVEYQVSLFVRSVGAAHPIDVVRTHPAGSGRPHPAGSGRPRPLRNRAAATAVR